MAEVSPVEQSSEQGGPNWQAWSTVVALVGLIVALVFNGIQARDSAEAQRETQRGTEQAREATELGLLTQLQSLLNDSVYARTAYLRQFKALNHGHALTGGAYQAVAREASDMDYLAWLFNKGYIAIRGADQLWGPLMVCEFQNAIYPAFPQATRDFPRLWTFIEQRGRALSASGPPCNKTQ